MQQELLAFQATTDEMVTILSTFESRLNGLEQEMLPIHQMTQSLSLAKSNIDESLVQIEKISSNFRVADEAFEIKKGLQPGGDVTAFVEAVEKVHDAHEYLQAHPHFKSTKTALLVLAKLQQRAMRDCQSEFSRLVGTYAVTSEALPRDRDNVATKVQQLCECMESSGHYDHLDIYSISRSEALRIILEQQMAHTMKTEAIQQVDN